MLSFEQAVDPMTSSGIDATILYSGVAAALVTASLILSQSDKVSQCILSPDRLRAKRRHEQLHMLEKAIASSILYVRKFINDGSFYDWKEEKKITDLILNDDEIQTLVKEIVIDSKSSTNETTNPEDYDEDDNINEEFQKTPAIVGIAKDLTLNKADEWYITLAFPVKSQKTLDDGTKGKIYYGRRVQVPLEKFGTYLALEFERKKSNTGLCFIADASSSLGSNVLGNVIKHSQCKIPVIHEPAWMFMLAFIIQRKALSREATQKVIYSLVKLNAQAVGHEVGETYNTVVFTLPGQSCSAALLPFLQRAFPTERHVFAYDGCFDSVERALSLSKHKHSHYDKGNKNKSIYSIPESSMPRFISSSIPLTPISLKNFPDKTAVLSSKNASIVEAWMSSVNTVISLKKKEGNNKFTPFVCRMGFLMQDSNFLIEESSTTSSIALQNVLEYVTGCGTNSGLKLDMNAIDAAESVLKDMKSQHAIEGRSSNILSHETRVNIEACISLHKSIVIGDKVLPDTVQPSLKNWSLKASKKSRG